MIIPEAYKIYKERFKIAEPTQIVELGDYYIFNDNTHQNTTPPSVNKTTGEIAFLNPMQMNLTPEDLQNRKVYEGDELDDLLDEKW